MVVAHRIQSAGLTYDESMGASARDHADSLDVRNGGLSRLHDKLLQGSELAFAAGAPHVVGKLLVLQSGMRVFIVYHHYSNHV